MKSLLVAIAFISFATLSLAQIKAVTTTGEEVVLNPDGSWKYITPPASAKEISTNAMPFVKSKEATFQVTSKIIHATVSLNPKKWSFAKGAADAAEEFKFEMKGDKDGGAMLIPEKAEMSLEALRGVAFDNAKAAAPDITIVKEEYRTVNGKKMLYMQMDGTVSGIKISYVGYYYAGKGGIAQLLSYTGQNLLAEYNHDLEELLNGLEIAD